MENVIAFSCLSSRQVNKVSWSQWHTGIIYIIMAYPGWIGLLIDLLRTNYGSHLSDYEMGKKLLKQTNT